MPNFGKNARPRIPMSRFNPYIKADRKKMSATARDAGFDALWDSLPEAPQ